jgi:hypothetical protein
MARSLRVLVTNQTIAGHRGARTVTRDLLNGLLRAGHRPMLYTRALGPLADELRLTSIPVTDDIATLDEAPDIIHGQHWGVTTLAVARFPQAPAIFVCHDFTAWHDAPPLLPQIRRWAAISDGFSERLTSGGVDPTAVRVVLNAVDLDRYRPGPPLPERPRRALSFAKNLEHLPAVRAACAEAGLELDVVGGAVGKVIDPSRLMADYDLVFASALTAIEAMATGRAVVVCDGRGLAGMVDPERYPVWRRENFGLRILSGPLTAEAVSAELARYDPDAAAAVSAQVRAECGLPQWIAAWEALYAEAMAEHRAKPLTADLAARGMAVHLQAWTSEAGPGFPWMAERTRLIEQARAPAPALPALQPGESVSPGAPACLLHGFNAPEPWGAWSARAVCSTGLRIAPEVRRLALDYRVNFGSGRDRFEFEVLANGLPLDRWTDEAGKAPFGRTLDIPSDLAAPDGRLWLSFRTSSPRPPAASEDPRDLGFGLARIKAG